MRRGDAARGADESDGAASRRQGSGRAATAKAVLTGALLHRPAAWSAAALLLASTLLDLAGARIAPDPLWQTAYRLQAAGLIVAGLVAAPLGIADAWRAARGQRIPRVTAGTHVGAVVLGVLLHLLAFVLRAHPRIPPDPGVLIIEGAGSLLVVTAIAAGIRMRRRLTRRR